MATKRKHTNKDSGASAPAREGEITKNPAPPTCMVVRRKEPGQPGIPCNNPAEFVVNVADPEDNTLMLASLLLCQACSERFDKGKTLVVETKSGDHVLVRASVVE